MTPPKAITGRAVIATNVGAVAATRILMITPLLLGAWADRYGLDAATLGMLASTEFACVALASMASGLWITRVDPRRCFGVCLLLLAIGDYASFHVPDQTSLFVLRAGLGIAAGVISALGAALFAQAAEPTRIYGYYVGAQFLYGFFAFVALPPLMIGAGTLPLEITVAATSGVAALWVPWVPDRRLERATGLPRGRLPSMALLLLGATAVFFIVQLGVWAFAERMGMTYGFDAVAIGNALASTSLFGGLCAFAVGVAERRFGTLPMLLLACALEIVGLALLFEPPPYLAYALGLTLFSMGWAMVPALMFGLLAAVTRDARVTGLMPAAQTLGMAMGPMAFGLIILPSDYRALIGTAVGLLAAFVGLMLYASGRARNL